MTQSGNTTSTLDILATTSMLHSEMKVIIVI